MKKLILLFIIISFVLVSTPIVSVCAQDRGLATAHLRGVPVQVKGKLDSIGGVPVLSVWGAPWEQGFAHGYLLQEKIVQFFDRFLSSGKIMNPQQYEMSFSKTCIFQFPPNYEAELRGMLAGIEARAGGPIQIPAVKRALGYGDLVMANCMGEMGRIRMSCSSFAAWGSMTKEGSTIAGRNYEWPLCPSMIGRQVVIVRIPPPGSHSLGTVSVFFPGLIGCITAMNEEGVTIATHDSNSNPPAVSWGFTPHTLLYRLMLESAHGEKTVEDIRGVLHHHFCITGNNAFVTRPYTGNGPGAFVFEHDACLANSKGVTVREPKAGNEFLVCSNRYYKRSSGKKASSCMRFAELTRQLKDIARKPLKKPIVLDGAEKITKSVPIPGLATYHRVIFEPNERLMHVKFPTEGEPVKGITLDVKSLLKQAREASR